MILRPDQREAANAAASQLRESDRVTVVMPCGSGKTLVGIATAAALNAQVVVVAAPTRALVAQLAATWASKRPTTPVLIVSSDSAATDDDVDASEPASGATVTTHLATATEWLANHSHGATIITTYRSLAGVTSAAMRAANITADLAIFDEAHHMAGTATASLRSGKLAHDPGTLPARARMYMTATPRIVTGVGESLSMDDTSTFGPVAYHQSFGSAVESGILADYEIVAAEIPSEYAHHALDPDTGQLTTSAIAAITARAIEDHTLASVLTFSATVERAEHLATSLPGRLRPRVVSAHSSPADRAAALSDLAAATATHPVVVANCRIFSEGVDVPALDAVVLADVPRSAVTLVQAVGRVMRRAPGKTRGRIIVPVLTTGDHLRGPDLSRAWPVLAALRAHDERLNSELLRLLGFDLQSSTDPSLEPREGAFPLLDAILPSVLRDALTTNVLVEITTEWDRRYAAVPRTAAERGHARVPQAEPLGRWVSRQRTLHNNGALPADRAAMLAALPGWAWDAFEARWQEGYAHLAAHVAEHGHAAVPQGHEVDGFALGNWVGTQRRNYAARAITQTRRDRLERLPGWAWSPHDEARDELLRRIRAYADEHGHARPTIRETTADGYTIGDRVRAVRERYRQGRVPADFIAALEQLPGWTWEPPTGVAAHRDPKRRNARLAAAMSRRSAITQQRAQEIVDAWYAADRRSDAVERLAISDSQLGRCITSLRAAGVEMPERTNHGWRDGPPGPPPRVTGPVALIKLSRTSP